ncbi:hypothetical protein [Oceaniglobus trochenteri]|uniref:hypothetical protein n=1 Tax=Oceaniglobus trochenteri TaxID=2763260 RepID=UPI001CFFED9D|nr:hypothetical protein [Oceaniglobus trochenteri]
MTAVLGRLAILGAVLATGLGGCGVQQRLGFAKAEPEIVLPFQSKLSKGDDARRFSVRVAANGASIADVRESARHPATGYCLLNFGGSAIDWDTDASGEWQATRDDKGGLVFSGACTAR